MSGQTGPGRETYMVGGNLLNEQERIAREAERHLHHGDEHAADPVEGGTEEFDDVESDNVERPVPGAAIPEQRADSITEEQHTEGGGGVPPGSAEAGHTVRRHW